MLTSQGLTHSKAGCAEDREGLEDHGHLVLGRGASLRGVFRARRKKTSVAGTTEGAAEAVKGVRWAVAQPRTPTGQGQAKAWVVRGCRGLGRGSWSARRRAARPWKGSQKAKKGRGRVRRAVSPGRSTPEADRAGCQKFALWRLGFQGGDQTSTRKERIGSEDRNAVCYQVLG